MAMLRRTLREQIFKLLFRVEFLPGDQMKKQEEMFFDSGDQTYSEEDRKEISDKFEKILQELPEIDRMIAEITEGRGVERIGKVELTILRLALYEMKEDDTVPEKVAINEAVELAKKFGQDDSPAFVNAILSKFTEEGEKEAPVRDKKEALRREEKEKLAKERSGGAEVHIVSSRKTKD